jgi:hypothetical protein
MAVLMDTLKVRALVLLGVLVAGCGSSSGGAQPAPGAPPGSPCNDATDCAWVLCDDAGSYRARGCTALGICLSLDAGVCKTPTPIVDSGAGDSG